MSEEATLSCPLPISDYQKIVLAHGGGGSLTNELVDKLFGERFKDPQIDLRHDGALLGTYDKPLAFSTDTHVVSPIFFPGGDIGKLAVCGTTNDLAMCGAVSSVLSVGFILEEGLPMDRLVEIVNSMKRAADEAGARIVTGDTKVVEKGKGDGVYINVSGVGAIEAKSEISPRSVEPDDTILLCGDVGRHGVAVMAAREGIAFDTDLKSDCAPLSPMIRALIDSGVRIHCLRDLTRGGLATSLVELSESCRLNIEIEENTIPVSKEVDSACEFLGLDPMYVANEGRCIVILPQADAELALDTMRRFEPGQNAVRIGQFSATQNIPHVTAATSFGTRRLLTLLSGEQLPRIC